MARKPVGRVIATESDVRVRRAYFDCRFGQLHVRTAFPTSGGFDEHTTLLCLHQSSASGRVFNAFLPEIARDRSVYAPDMPGCGESDAPSSRPAIADYAAAMADFLDAMRFRQIDILGYQSGALIAAELAIMRPEIVRRLILVSVPVFTADERAAHHARPLVPSEDGSHLVREWQRTLQWRGPGMTLEMTAESFAEKIRNGLHSDGSAGAAHNYAANERLPLVRQRALLVRLKDDLWDNGLRARQYLRSARTIDLPEYGFGLFSVAPQIFARHAREFLGKN